MKERKGRSKGGAAARTGRRSWQDRLAHQGGQSREKQGAACSVQKKRLSRPAAGVREAPTYQRQWRAGAPGGNRGCEPCWTPLGYKVEVGSGTRTRFLGKNERETEEERRQSLSRKGKPGPCPLPRRGSVFRYCLVSWTRARGGAGMKVVRGRYAPRDSAREGASVRFASRLGQPGGYRQDSSPKRTVSSIGGWRENVGTGSTRIACEGGQRIAGGGARVPWRRSATLSCTALSVSGNKAPQ